MKTETKTEQTNESVLSVYELPKKDLSELKQQLENASKNINVEPKFAEMENVALEKFLKDIKGFVHHEKYEKLKSYLSIITNPKSKINCLVIEGEQGLGKTISVKNMLTDLKKDICYINSYTTALSFYMLVYQNRFKTIILDDVFGLYGDEKGIAILRALTNTDNVRYINYQSTSDKLSVPSSFIFEGNVVILTNRITEQMDNSLMGRAIHRVIKFSLQEKIEFMEKIARFHYSLKDEELKEIMDFIKEEVDDTTKNFSFRTLIKLIEFFKQDKENWKELGYEELEKDEELVFVKSIMNYPIEERNKKWYEETGMSVRTLRRRIKELKENRTFGHSDKNVDIRKEQIERGVKNGNK